MPCAECDKLQAAYREAAHAFTVGVSQLLAAKGTPEFSKALDNALIARRATHAARKARKKHFAEQHGVFMS